MATKQSTDVADLPASALRSALEFAVAIAGAGLNQRPPLPFPAALKPFVKFQRLSHTSLVAVRRVVANEESFRDGLALAATSDLVDELGLVWLQRGEGWQDTVMQLYQAAQDSAREAADEGALRKSERRREAAEQVAARAQAELLSARDDLTRELAQRARVESASAAAVAGAEASRREAEQLRRELHKARAREMAATARADLADARVAASAEACAELKQVRDALLADRAAQASTVPIVPTAQSAPRSSPTSSLPAEAHARTALEQAAAATQALATSLSAAAAALVGRPADAHAEPVEPRRARASATKRVPIAIPGGLLGDSVAGTTHLLRTPKVVVIVDGYNVAKLGWPRLDLLRQRECCIELLEDLARRFGCDIRVIFDGADVVGASAGRRLIRVQFSPADVIADDVIRSEVALLSAATPAVVVTNDQAIHTDVRARGANVVSSDMLLTVGGRTAGKA